MAIVRAQHSLHDKSGLPEDVYVNTWYFNCAGGAGEDEAEAIWLLLAGFYAGGAGVNKVVSYLSPQLNGAYDIKFYDMADALPRTPFAERASDYGSMGQGTGVGLPSEVACCMSYSADPVSGVPAGRLRGRLYFGPCDIDAGEGSSTVTSVVNSSFMGALATQAGGMAAAGRAFADDVIWGMWSPTRGAFSTITSVWIDNAWDTQRRRGHKATARQTVAV